MTKKIHVYSTKDCPYCTDLKQMLDNHLIPYEVTDVDEEEKEWEEMCKTLNIEFVPTVIIVDDVLATGGTLQATNWLAEKSGYDVIGNLVLMDLKYVPRVDNFDIEVRSLVTYE